VIKLIAAVLFPAFLVGQSPGLSTIVGRVSGPDGAAVAGALVSLIRIAGAPLETRTNSFGHYAFPAIPPGVYDLQVSAPGFAHTTVGGLKADISRSRMQDVQLVLESVRTAVEVTAERAPIDTTDSSIGNVIGGTIVQRLPNSSRDASLIFRYQPGIHQNGETNGARADQNSIILDGGDASTPYGTFFSTSVALPVEAVEEVRVIVSNPVASLTRGSGAQFSVETKSGTNAFHGSSYWYLQNDALNANSWINNRLSIARPAYRDNRVGASLGGPLRRDRTYFFSAFEIRRRTSSSTFSSVVPTATLRQGILRFRDGSGEIRNINPRDFDPRALGANPAILSILDRYPQGNNTSGLGDGLNTTGYTFSAPVPSYFGVGLFRLDHTLSANWRLNASGRLSQSDFALGGQLDLIERRPLRSSAVYGRYATVALTGSVKPSLTNRLQISWLHDRWGNGGQPLPLLGTLNTGADLGGTVLGDLVTAGNAARWQRGRANTLSFADQFHWQRGRHQWQGGVSFRRVEEIDSRNNKLSGALTAPVAAIGAANMVAVPAASRPSFLRVSDVRNYNVLYSTLLGVVDSVSVLRIRDAQLKPLEAGTPLSNRAHFYQTEMFLQDVWRVAPSLTVTLGVAYGWSPPAVEEDGRQIMAVYASNGKPILPQAYLDQKRAAAEAGTTFNPDFGFQPVENLGRTTIYDADWRNFSPRLSFAWNPAGTGLFGGLLGPKRTVIRGGYGLLYDRTTITTMIGGPSFGLGFGQSYVSSPRNGSGAPFRVGVDGTIPLPDAPRLSTPLVPGVEAPESLSMAVDPGLRTPRNHALNFSLQRELPWRSVFEISYVGRMGRHLYQGVNLNSFPYMFRDKTSGQSFAQAFDAVAAELRRGVAPGAVSLQPWFENLLPTAGTRGVASERAEDIISGNVSNLAQFYMNGLLRAPIQNGQVLDMVFNKSDGRSNYHAALVTWNKRFSTGVHVTANYSYSKSLDQFGNYQDDFTIASDSYNRDVNYGPSVFDHRHLFSSLWFYDLPSGRSGTSRSGLLRHLTTGWWLSGLFFANTGEPMDVTGGAQSFGGGTQLQYPAAAIPVAKPEFDNQVHHNNGGDGIGTATGTSLNRYASPAAMYRNFRYPRISVDGRTGRGALRDYINWNLDLSVGKMTPIGDRMRAGFSMEFLNVLNRVIFFNPTLDLSLPGQFGVLSTQWNSPRVIQAGLRLEW